MFQESKKTVGPQEALDEQRRAKAALEEISQREERAGAPLEEEDPNLN